MLFGAVGGAYSLFIQAGSIVLFSVTLWAIVNAKAQPLRENIKRSLSSVATLSAVKRVSTLARRGREADKFLSDSRFLGDSSKPREEETEAKPVGDVEAASASVSRDASGPRSCVYLICDLNNH